MYILSPCGKFKYHGKNSNLLNSAVVVFEPSELAGNSCDLTNVPMINFKNGLQIILFGDKQTFSTGASSKLPEKIKQDLIKSKDKESHYICYYDLKENNEVLNWAKNLVKPYGLTCSTSCKRNNPNEDRKKIVDFYSGKSEYLNLNRF